MIVTVNKHVFEIEEITSSKTLLSWLRDDLDLTGTKNGCGIGVCGSCTVLVNGIPRRSCKLLLKNVANAEIITIEGLAQSDGSLHPIQQAFVDVGAIQCGFCTPGMVLTAFALLQQNPNPSRQQCREAIKGNLCRCTGYQQIIDAIMLAAKRLRGEEI